MSELRRLTAIHAELARYRTKAAATTHRDPAVDRAFADVEAAVARLLAQVAESDAGAAARETS